MTKLVTRFDEEELALVLTEYLARRGLKVSGRFQWANDPGDQRGGGAGTSVSVELEMIEPSDLVRP